MSLKSLHRHAREEKRLLYYPSIPSRIQGKLARQRGRRILGAHKLLAAPSLPAIPHPQSLSTVTAPAHQGGAAAFLFPTRIGGFCSQRGIVGSCPGISWLFPRGLSQALPREAAWSKQFPSPVVARGSRRWQLGSTVTHQLRRPGEIWEECEKTRHSTGLGDPVGALQGSILLKPQPRTKKS